MKKIAIYSGVIPSTTFIERLIEGIAIDDKVLLFGYLESNKKYSKNVVVCSYRNRFQKLLVVLKYTILLFLFNANEKKKLDKIINKNQKKNSLQKLKFYPVLYHKPDIFHLQWAKGIEEWIWVEEFGIKMIVSLRGTHITISPYANENLKETYLNNFDKVTAFHAVSNSIAKELNNYTNNPLKVKVIYSGLNLDKFPYNKKKNIAKPLKILSVGRSHWVKGYQCALDACKILKQDNIPFHYTIIGINENEELLFQLHDLQLKDSVSFINSLPFDNVIKHIQEATILLLPSVEEGIANVVLEAMALGTLVISTNCGGMPEVISDKKNGYLIPARNPEAIAMAIKKCIALDLETYNAITQNARYTVEQNHTEQLMVQQFKELYTSVV